MSLVRPRFSRIAIMDGVRRSLPLQLALVPFGLVCGVVSQSKGLSVGEALLMSATCYAGSAQLLALSHWQQPAPVIAATVAALVVNLRLALMGPVLAPWLDRVRGWRLWTSLFLMADQNWAMSVREIQAGRGDAGFLFGSGVVMWTVWVVSTGLGHQLGAAIRPPSNHPLFFAALAVFIAILAGMWRGRIDVMPWLAAAGVSIITWRFLGGSTYIVTGAVAGAAVGVLRDRRI